MLIFLKFFAKLKTITNTTLIASNPSIELWFLLHYKNQTAAISKDECLRQLSNRNGNAYKKGVIDEALHIKLNDKCHEACKKAKKLRLYDNPSTSMFLLIEELERAKDEKSSL